MANAAAGAHRAIDATVEKVAPVIDSVHDKVEAAKGEAQSAKQAGEDARDKVAGAKDAADEWVGAARDAVREHPFAAIAGALLIGAAWASLGGRRR